MVKKIVPTKTQSAHEEFVAFQRSRPDLPQGDIVSLSKGDFTKISIALRLAATASMREEAAKARKARRSITKRVAKSATKKKP